MGDESESIEFDPTTRSIYSLLRRSGVTSPLTGLPYSEAMIFGLGGGIGMMYFVFEYKDQSPILSIIPQYHTKSGGYTGFADGTLSRTCGNVKLMTTSSANSATKQLRNEITAGKPVLVWTGADPVLPAEDQHYLPLTVVVYGVDSDGETALIDDPRMGESRIEMSELEQRRGAMRAMKHRAVSVTGVSNRDPSEALMDAIRATVANMLTPEMSNFGVPALERWAKALGDSRDRRGWSSLFPRVADLHDAMVSVRRVCRIGGGGLRGSYAQFLEEAGELLSDTRFSAVAEQYRALAAMWLAMAKILPLAISSRTNVRLLLDDLGACVHGIAIAEANAAEALATLVSS